MTDIRKLINIIQEAEQLQVADPKIKEIAQDIKQGEVPDGVLAKLKNFLTNLISGQVPEEPETDPGEEPVEETSKIVSGDLQVFELLKKTKPEDADKIWAFYNRAMIADHLVPMCVSKDIVKQDDQDRIVNLFINAPGTLEDKVSLAAKLQSGGGVIDVNKMLQAGSGSIDKLINYKSAVLADIKYKLISFKVSPSTTAVNTGDGEAFFLILGTGINKLGAGDLNVHGREVEVKAQGARLKGFGGKGTYGDGATYWPKFNKELLSLIGKKGYDEFINAGVDLKSEPLHFGGKALALLSNVLATTKPGAKPVKEMFDNALKHIYPKTTPEMRKNVLNTIDSKGSFDPEEFRKGWFMLTYEYYMATSIDPKTGTGFDGILFIHQPSFTYNYIKNKEQLEKNWGQFELNSGLYNWTDAPSVAPKITFGKEERARKSRAKAEPTKTLAKRVDITPPGRSTRGETAKTPRARR